MLAEAIVGRTTSGAAGRWRIYLWPGLAFALGVLMWPVMTFFTNSAIHMVAHGAWAQALMVMGAAELGLARGQAAEPLVEARDAGRRWPSRARRSSCTSRTPGSSPARRSCTTWSAGRWSLGVALPARARLPAALGRAAVRLRDRCSSRSSVMLFSDRDVAPVFGHLSPLAGAPHR